MFRRYLLTGFVAGFLSISSTLYPVKLTDTRGVKDYVESFLFNGVYAAESEIILKDNTTASGLTVKEETANTTIARFRGDGNVGIGTSNPAAPLDIASAGRLRFSHNNGDIEFVEAADLIARTTTSSPVGTEGALSLSTGSGMTRLVTVLNNGNVGIGTTGPQTLLHVKNSGTVDGTFYETLRLESSNSGVGAGPYIQFRNLASIDMARIGTKDISGFGGSLVFFTKPADENGFGASAERMRIDAKGNVGIGTTSPQHPLHMGSGAHVTTGGVWTNASSREYKENIRDLTVDEAMRALDGLRPSRFNYKVDDEDEYVGFIAEDVPELVATRDRKGLSPMDLTAVITKVVQEQQRMLQAQQEAMDKMKQEIKMLKSAMNYGVKGL